ncbi:mCG144829, partial [Mus musculus]
LVSWEASGIKLYDAQVLKLLLAHLGIPSWPYSQLLQSKPVPARLLLWGRCELLGHPSGKGAPSSWQERLRSHTAVCRLPGALSPLTPELHSSELQTPLAISWAQSLPLSAPYDRLLGQQVRRNARKAQSRRAESEHLYLDAAAFLHTSAVGRMVATTWWPQGLLTGYSCQLFFRGGGALMKEVEPRWRWSLSETGGASVKVV